MLAVIVRDERRFSSSLAGSGVGRAGAAKQVRETRRELRRQALVDSWLAIEGVGSRATANVVVVVAALDGVGSALAADDVITCATKDLIGASAAHDLVDPWPAADDVIAGATTDRVIAACELQRATRLATER